MATPRQPDLYTCSYRQFEPSMGVAVRITLGGARGFRYPHEHVPELAPTRELFKIDDRDEFERQYRARLDAKFPDPARLAERFAAISAAHGGRPLCLLCFEDLSKPAEWCHRRTFAAIWCEWTGQEVPELGSGDTA